MAIVIVAVLLAALVSTTIALLVSDLELRKLDERISELEREQAWRNVDTYIQNGGDRSHYDWAQSKRSKR